MAFCDGGVCCRADVPSSDLISRLATSNKDDIVRSVQRGRRGERRARATNLALALPLRLPAVNSVLCQTMPGPRTRTRTLPTPLPVPDRPILALGLEGSANKLGAGLILHSPPSSTLGSSSKATPNGGADSATSSVSILSNIRHTYVTPPGEGFLPSDTARHHKSWITQVIAKALASANKTMADVDVICFTQGKRSDQGLSKVRPSHFSLVDRVLCTSHRTWNGRAASNCSTRRSHTSSDAQQATRRRQPLRRP